MNGKRIVYVQTSGPDAPERVYAPFILAIAAAATGTQATIYFFLKGVTVLRRRTVKQMTLEGYPPLDSIVGQAVRSGVTLQVCAQSCALYGLSKQDLIDQIYVVGAPALNDRILEADGVLTF